MEVTVFPNARRPGVGLKPRRESQRPLLPQHARHCPVLEAGSSLGFLVYPPLEPNESFHVGYQGEGRYRFVYYVNPTGSKWEAVFAVTTALPVGGSGGMFTEEVTFMTPIPSTTKENALLMARSFMVPEDIGTPAGAVTLRGAWNFQTPTGWDAVYTPIFNSIERPVAPMMVVRVETDWYPHESEFRYVLQQGEGMSCSRTLPIGQVFFVPREPITLRDGTEDERAAFQRAQAEFSRDKAAVKLTTNYGLQYSPHYARKSRSMSAPAHPHAQEAGGRTSGREPVPGEGPRAPIIQKTEMPGAAAATAHAARPAVPPSQPTARIPKVGRNEPCPCGSGKKYKWCHGEG